ncbi:hypothetical protein P4126_28865 [Pseudomonas aeruginosa]|nr:hypothetical protein [Pseudomonas aeruginosa]MDF5884534.1 hypothetical protein [Pseudomonas aeruginosa]MDF5936646.1 hypothetical protein [Pseudomonas aeruginosa]MDW0133135.1 hypothetical protein [Pseudomonas aeruginosa]
MSQEIERYLQAGTRASTRRSYQQALEHFEVTWGGFLPATSDAIVRYLVDHAAMLSSNTLKLRLAALAQWHVSQGFPDPTKTPLVRQILKGIRTLHPRQEKQAEPLQLRQLEQCVLWLEQAEGRARAEDDWPRLLRCCRDRALMLIGFWRAFRSDELCRLQVEHIQVRPGRACSCFCPGAKVTATTKARPSARRRWPGYVQYKPTSTGSAWRASRVGRYSVELIAGGI